MSVCIWNRSHCQLSTTIWNESSSLRLLYMEPTDFQQLRNVTLFYGDQYSAHISGHWPRVNVFTSPHNGTIYKIQMMVFNKTGVTYFRFTYRYCQYLRLQLVNKLTKKNRQGCSPQLMYFNDKVVSTYCKTSSQLWCLMRYPRTPNTCERFTVNSQHQASVKKASVTSVNSTFSGSPVMLPSGFL
jgi:hypothetical protein